VHHGIDAVGPQQPSDRLGVAGVAVDELSLDRNSGPFARTQVVDNENLLARVQQGQNRVAADIRGRQ
jgi:hypothetical protein